MTPKESNVYRKDLFSINEVVKSNLNPKVRKGRIKYTDFRY